MTLALQDAPTKPDAPELKSGASLAATHGCAYVNRLKRSEWEVLEVSIETARALVEKYHYAKGASNTRIHTHGLFRAGAFWENECVGVAWWLPPTRAAAEATYPPNWQGVLSLSRLVIAPDVPKNACTFLLARSVKMIDAKRWPCLVTYADDWRGHTGGIYRAANWQYLGKTKAHPTYVIDGVMTARKAGPRTRTHSEMLALGAVCEGNHAKHKFVLIRGKASRHKTSSPTGDEKPKRNRGIPHDGESKRATPRRSPSRFGAASC